MSKYFFEEDEKSFDDFDIDDDSNEDSEDEDTVDSEDDMNYEIPSSEEKEVDQSKLIEELNKIFTPVLIMQNYETDKTDQIKEVLSEASLLTEKNIIQFDNETKMAQLISTCAVLIARAKNSEDYQKFIQASREKKQAKLDIQTKEYDNAKSLAQKYLVNVSTKNGSAVARRVATELLPESN